MPSGAQTPDGITFSCSNLFKTLSPIFSFTMGLTGHTPSSSPWGSLGAYEDPPAPALARIPLPGIHRLPSGVIMRAGPSICRKRHVCSIPIIRKNILADSAMRRMRTVPFLKEKCGSCKPGRISIFHFPLRRHPLLCCAYHLEIGKKEFRAIVRAEEHGDFSRRYLFEIYDAQFHFCLIPFLLQRETLFRKSAAPFA